MANKKQSPKILGIRQRTHNRVDKIMDRAESIGKSSKERIIRQKERVITMREGIDSYIQKKPKRSLLIAAGIGAILAILMIRRR